MAMMDRKEWNSKEVYVAVPLALGAWLGGGRCRQKRSGYSLFYVQLDHSRRFVSIESVSTLRALGGAGI